MTLLDYMAAAAGGWLILAALGGTSWVLVVSALKRRKPMTAEDRTRWVLLLPPVPPAKPTYTPDDEWLSVWPTDDDESMRLRFDQIVSAEGWAA